MLGSELQPVNFGGLIVLGSLLVTAVFQVLWNMTMPEVFGLKAIRYWVAFRLLLIGLCLSGGLHFTVRG